MTKHPKYVVLRCERENSWTVGRLCEEASSDWPTYLGLCDAANPEAAARIVRALLGVPKVRPLDEESEERVCMYELPDGQLCARALAHSGGHSTLDGEVPTLCWTQIAKNIFCHLPAEHDGEHQHTPTPICAHCHGPTSKHWKSCPQYQAPDKITEAELPCTRCGEPLGNESFVGDGDGTGQKFAHYRCHEKSRRTCYYCKGSFSIADICDHLEGCKG